MNTKLKAFANWADRYGALILAILWTVFGLFSFFLAVFGKLPDPMATAQMGVYQCLLAQAWFTIDFFNRKN